MSEKENQKNDMKKKTVAKRKRESVRVDQNKGTSEEKSNKQSGRPSLVQKLIHCISLGVFAYAVTSLIIIFLGYYMSEQEYKDLLEDAVVIETTAGDGTKEETKPAETETKETGAEETEQETTADDGSVPYYPIKVDDKLFLSVNKDYIGYIVIPGTGISYPFVQGTDNNHYLRYTFRNSENMAGCIFLDYRTPLENRFDVFNTIIIGHNRHDDTMFAHLTEYMDYEYCKENPYIYIVYQGKEYAYSIIGAFEYATSGPVFNPNSDSRQIMNEINQNNSYPDAYQVQTTDKIISLYTCSADAKSRIFCIGLLKNVYDMQ